MTTGNVSDCGSHCNDNKTERKRNGQCRQRKGRENSRAAPQPKTTRIIVPRNSAANFLTRVGILHVMTTPPKVNNLFYIISAFRILSTVFVKENTKNSPLSTESFACKIEILIRNGLRIISFRKNRRFLRRGLLQRENLRCLQLPAL